MNKGQAVFRTYTTLGRCLSALPEPVALGLGDVVGDVLYRVRHEHRAQVSANLERVLGADGDDAQVVDRWARRSFRAYARYWVEGARLPGTGSDEVCTTSTTAWPAAKG
jgi:lauroyl/myristoyl acyltransferase